MADSSQYKDLNLVMAEATDCLWDKLETIGNQLTELMDDSNRNPDTVAAYEAEDKIDGILFVLTTLGIPHEVHQQVPVNWYTAVDIAGRTFYVNSGGAGSDSQ